ncbi:MAG TPA: hypothetical protein VFP49_10615 [Nitrososphaeraceae archaeon]|nr:hypothetical protein [Nitrososphaeraceae archaeon]
MIALIATVLIDTSIVKVYDLVDKSFISDQTKFLLFSINTSICLVLEFIVIKYLYSLFKRHRLKRTLNVNLLYRISLISLLVIVTLMGLLTFQQFYNKYYKVSISILIIITSYVTATGFIIRLSMLFISWYKSHHNKIIFLYFISMLLIAFNLVMTATITVVKLIDRPDEIRKFVGGTVDISVGKYVFLDNVYKASSILSFISIWITTALLMNYYREKLINAILYWILLSIPLVYFLINYFYQFIFANILTSYLTIDPITVSIILTTFLSLSKPIGGLTFAVVFWNISKIIGYEKNIKSYMVISGWGILLIFGANQALVQSLAPYPPFGLVTITVLIIGAFLMLSGIYNSAVLVSANDRLRKSIYKYASEPRLLGLIGQAEMKKEIERIVTEVTLRKDSLERVTNAPIEFDEKELKRYIDFVIREIRKEGNTK